MRWMAIIIWAGVTAGPVVAQTATPPAAPAAPASLADQLAEANARAARMQQLLGAANRELDRLRAIETAAAQDKASLDLCKAKNMRLARAGREILAAYDRRYHRGVRDPLQLGRRRFEAEVQEYGDRIYENKYDVPLAQQSPDVAAGVPDRDGKKRKGETKGK